MTYARRNFIPILVKVAMLKGIVASTFNADAQPSGIARAPIWGWVQRLWGTDGSGHLTDAGGDGGSASDVEDQEGLEIAVGRLSVHMISSDLKFAWFIVA